MPEDMIINFKIRFIPKALHTQWKALSATLDMSMEDFAKKAIAEKIIREFEKRKANA